VDRDLVVAAQHGDREAFEVIASAVGDRIYALARLILRDADLAEDAVQEALVRTWRELPTLRDPDRFEAWVHRLTVNCCTDEARRQRRWSAHVRVLRLDPAAGDDSRLLADRDQLERGFRRLRPEQRAVVVLHFYRRMAVPEIASLLGLPAGTVKSRLHYATQALRAALESDARGGLTSGTGDVA
jgi:RNA polymerase sigma-70 factor (ECF subfamily)